MADLKMAPSVTRVDFLINKMTAGGAERVISLLANHLCQDPAYRVRVITFQGEDAYPLDERVERVRLHRVFLFRSVVVNGFFQLLWFYRKKKNRPDVMSSHIDLLGYLTIPVAFFYGIPLIVSEHNNHKANNSRWQRFLWNYLYRIPKAVTILTGYDLEHFRKKNRRVVVMPNPCTFPLFNAPAGHTRRREILSIGSLNRYHQKGYDNLIPIMAEVLPHFPEWKLKMVGGGDQGKALLESLVQKHGLKGQIEFMGIRSDVQELLRCAEIFILPSRFEGLPMVLLEAMSQGIACISYDCVSGPSDVIAGGENGVLVPDQQPAKMVESLKELMSDEGLRRKYQQNAPLAMDKFSLEQVGHSWKTLIREVLNDTKPQH
ncbi:glycosyltransferase family 4 protein [Robiginitalea sediminis]|uniref:glycosyltransferase family 4 protein n=1 Tax=Robiginitalea sediminis TaxID=1982593 RepID=UPI0013035EF3|nr:glycosyltransferase family 4 protein [Robiginitalea sediminis]